MTQTLELLCFALDRERFALATTDVDEVLRSVLISPLPRAPGVIEGVINVRGSVLPVFNIRRRFGLPPRPLRPQDRMIVVRAAGRKAVLRCDGALELQDVAVQDVDAAERISEGARLISGVARLPDGLVFIHSPHSFLTESERVQLEEALEEQHAGELGPAP